MDSWARRDHGRLSG